MFRRHRFGEPPNNLLNYGYAVLRAIVARSLVASGLLTAVGIHHRNKYNPYCLADDIMEPFRPYVDELVYSLADEKNDLEEITPELKGRLLNIPTKDVTV
jgi:CRISPR-associated protein Cas1